MKTLLSRLLLAVLLLGSPVILRAQTDVQPYFPTEEMPDLIQCLPAPPDSLSAGYTYDIMRYMWGKTQRQDPEIAARVRRDAVWTYEALLAEFWEPFGMVVTKEATPEIWKVLETKNFNVGVGYRTNSWNGFKLQPELLYNVRGTRIDNVTNWKMSYLELPVNVQWGIDLIVLRPFLQVAPFIGYDFQNVTSDTAAGNTLDDHNVTTGANRFEYGVSVGGGLDLLDRIQLSVTYNWNFGAVANLEAYKDQIAGIDRLNARCLQISMAYMF